MTVQKIIRKISFFNNLSDEQINIIASISTVSKQPNKSILYYESDINKNLLHNGFKIRVEGISG